MVPKICDLYLLQSFHFLQKCHDSRHGPAFSFICSVTLSTFISALSVSTVEVIDSEQCVLVVDGLVDCDEKGEGGGQLNPTAQLLVAPVEAAQPLSQVPSACSLQSILQQLGLIGLVP